MGRNGAEVGSRPGRMRRYWQGLMIAAAVSYGQLHAEGDLKAPELPPYVRMLPGQPPRFHPLEVVGHEILTVPLELDATRDR